MGCQADNFEKQRMIENIRVAGFLFTYAPNSGVWPLNLINYRLVTEASLHE